MSIKHKTLRELLLVALTRSDRVLDVLLANLQQPGLAPFEKLDRQLKQAVRETLFDMLPGQLRWDDIDRVLEGTWQPIGGGYALGELNRAAEKYLTFKNHQVAVKPEQCTAYQATINQIHPAFIIAAQYTRHQDINTLPLLKNQCPLGFSANDQDIAYADNHVHFGGVHGAEVLSRLLFDEIDRQALDNMNLPRVPEFTLVNSDNYSVAKLVSLYRLTFNTFCRITFETPEQQSRTLNRLPDRLKSAQYSDPFKQFSRHLYNRSRLAHPDSLTAQQSALLAMVELSKQGDHHQGFVAFAYALLLQLNNAGSPKVVSLTLSLIHLANILRGYVVMSGAGLTHFVDFFNSDIRRFNAGSGDNQALRWLLSGGNKAALKTSPPRDNFDWFAQMANQVSQIKQDPDNLDEHFHYCLHFVRDHCEQFQAGFAEQKHSYIRQQTQHLEQLLKSQIKHQFLTRRERLSGTKPSTKTLWVPSLVKGFDVAGNENHFPIHVFAPALRYLREKPFTIKKLNGEEVNIEEKRYLSIHAGEDYSDLITGLRHIDETVVYCNMDKGDRIGHALALGVDPVHWAKRQRQAFVHIEEDLFNTVWLYYHALILGENHKTAQQMIFPLAVRLENIQLQLFGDKQCYSHKQLWDYWQYRGNSHQHEKWMRNTLRFKDREYWVQFEADEKSKQRFAAIRLGLKNFRKQQYFTTINLSEINTSSDEPNPESPRYLADNELSFYRLLQDTLMMRYHNKGIVLEVCPSSNISLGRFEDYHQHPVFRWHPPQKTLFSRYDWDKFNIRNQTEIAVCINTDDPGIFPTKIEQEYKLLANAAEKHYKVDKKAVEKWIETLRKTSLAAFS